MMTPSLELPSDRQVMASISRRARDTALPENKLVLRPFPALSSTARTRPGVNGGKRESKDMLNDTLQWLRQKGEAQGSQKGNMEEEDQRQSESFSFFNPSQDQGIASSYTSSWPAVEGKRPHRRRRNSAGSGLHSAPAASGGDQPAFAPAPIGGSSREKPADDDNAATEGDDDQEEDDGPMHVRSTKRSWRSFFMNRAGRGSAAPCRKDLEHDSATRSKPSTPIWRSFFLGRSDRGNGDIPKAAAIKQRRRSLPLFRQRNKDLTGRWHRTKSEPEESRPIPVPGDSSGRSKVTRGRAGRSGSIPSTPSTTMSVSTGSTLSTSNYGTARRRNGANALPEASPKVPPVKSNLNPNPNPRLGVLSSAGATRLSKKEDVRESRDKGVVAPSSAGGGDDWHRRRSPRIGESKFDQLIQEASRSSTDLRGQENHRRDNDNDGISSNGGGRMAAAGTNSLSLKLEGLENRRGRNRDRGGSNINRGNRVASVDTGRLYVKFEGLQNRQGRSVRDLGGGSGVDRVAAAATTIRSRSLRSPSLAAAAKSKEPSGNGGPDRVAAGAGGDSNNGEVDAAAMVQRRDDAHFVGSMDSASALAFRAFPAPSPRQPVVKAPPKSATKATVSPRSAPVLPRKASGSVTTTRKPSATATSHKSRGSPSAPHLMVLATAAAEETNYQAQKKEPAGYSRGGGDDDSSRRSSTPSGDSAATISAALHAAVAASSNEWSDGSDSEGTDQAETAAAPENCDESPLPSRDGSGRPVDEQREQCLAPSPSPSLAAAAAAVPPRPACNPAVARSVFWRQTTGSLERVQDHLFGVDLHVYSHAPDGKALQKWRNERRTLEEGKPEHEESTATAATRAARKPNGANAAAAAAAARGRQKNRAQEAKAPRQQQPPAPPMSVWVAQHIDKSDRHGVAFLISDGSVVMRFRDGTVMVSEPMSGAGDREERGALEYYYVTAGKGKASPPSLLRFVPEGGVGNAAETTSDGGGDRGAGDVKKERRQDGQQQQGHVRRTRYAMTNVPPYLEKKAKLLVSFRGRLLVLAAEEDALHGGGGGRGGEDGGSRDRSRKRETSVAGGATTPWEPSVLVEAYRPTRHSCLFVLSDSTVQMAFSDRTKILMAGNSDLVTFIHGDGQRELETVSFAKALEDNRTDITERVEYLKKLIHFLQERERKFGGGNAARQTARE